MNRVYGEVSQPANRSQWEASHSTFGRRQGLRQPVAPPAIFRAAPSRPFRRSPVRNSMPIPSARKQPAPPRASEAAEPRFDWRKIAYHTLVSRAMDDVEESTNRN